VNEESRRLIDSGHSSLDLSYVLPGCWTTTPEIPETAIGYEETEVVRLARENGLSLQSLSYGKWCGRTEYLSYQDVAVFTKS
jgi:hypothetical protein